MKVDRYYDVQCDHCGRNLSTDYHLGFFTSRDTAIKVAKRIGFKTDKNNQNICPCCAGVVFTFNKKKYKIKATEKGTMLQQKVIGDWDKEKEYCLSSEVNHITKDELLKYAITYLTHYSIDYIEKTYGTED